MSRRTYQQAQAWRAAAVALLAEVGVEISPNPDSGKKTPHDVATGEQKIIAGRGQIVTYLSGKVSIGGPGPDADYLCEPLERHGLLNGWHPGSRGSGVVWVPQPEAPAVAARPALEVRWAQQGEGIGNLGLGVIVSGWEGRSAQELMEALLALPPRQVARGQFVPGDRVFVQGGGAGTVRHDAGGATVSVHFDGTHGPTSYPRVALQRGPEMAP